MSQLVTLAEPRSAAAEAYRALRTNLDHGQAGAAPSSLLFCSATDAADASIPAANLALVCAQAGRRVVLLDADLRRPSQAGLFGLAEGLGLSEHLSDANAGAAPLLNGPVDGLRILPAGQPPTDPAERLASPAMGQLLEQLQADCDLLVVDAPPAVAVTDAAILAAQLEGAVLVAAAGKSRRDDLRRARAILDGVGAKTLGVVLTEVDPRTAGYGGYG